MTYRETLSNLFASIPNYDRTGPSGYKPGLDNTIELCNLLENPQKTFKTIHVTGTNGKGSVSHMLASILQTKNLRVGLYTSPHLQDFRERIRVNGKKVPISFVTSFVNKHQGDFEKIKPSFFEMSVAMAFRFFKEQQVDIAVVEVGLGGRLDSTNIIIPLLSVITNVSYDHMQFLGDNLENIAAEKAGIIKPGIPIVIGETQKEIMDIFIRKARKTKSPITFADKHYSPENIRMAGKRIKNLVMDIYKEDELFIRHLSSPLPGLYQIRNILTVMGACEALNLLRFQITPEDIRIGIRDVVKRTELKGRWQVLSRKPLTICDTGHNTGGLTEVLRQIDTISFNHLHFVFGTVSDKPLDPILELLPRTATYYFCKADIPRGLDAKLLLDQARVSGLRGKAYPSVKAAMEAARKSAQPNDLIFIGGSTFVVGEAI